MTAYQDARQVKAVNGRLSFYILEAEAAFEEAKTGPYPQKSIETTSPYANILLTEQQYDRLLKQVLDEYLPACVELFKGDKTAPGALSPEQVEILIKEVDKPTGLYNIPFKNPTDKTLELYPDCAKVVKIMGKKGVNMSVEAIVTSQDEVKDTFPDIIVPDRLILPISKTNLKLYRGCWVVAKELQFYAYDNGGKQKPGFSLGGRKLVFSRDDTEFGGGPVAEDDDIFAAADAD